MLAIIPAREGSKRVVGKNTRSLGGIPLIAHTIKAAIKSKKIDRVIVSTDSQSIADISMEYGAEVPFLRPKSIARDETVMLDVFKYMLERLKVENGEIIDSFVALQPTSPFRNSSDIDSAIELFCNNNTDSVISFTKEAHPPEWNRIINDDNTFSNFITEEIYRFNGAVYVYKSKLIKNSLMYNDTSLAYVIPEERSLDIDTENDFMYAEFLINKNEIK
jgi:CMP-N,N'-diacetyllegionaminic acid synthase